MCDSGSPNVTPVSPGYGILCHPEGKVLRGLVQHYGQAGISSRQKLNLMGISEGRNICVTGDLPFVSHEESLTCMCLRGLCLKSRLAFHVTEK